MGKGREFSPDVFVEILLRLPTSARRRFRLVCRFWREVIDTRTTEMQSRPKTLAFVGDPGGRTVSAYVVDDLSEGLSRKLWTGLSTGNELLPSVSMVGTCNGLLCLCDVTKPGEITLVNPVTGETLLVPPLSTAGQLTVMNYQAFSFAYHPVTGQYKILHVPYSRYTNWDKKIDAMQVLTLGDASWRVVPTPGASCNLDHGIVCVNGTMFWVTAGGAKQVIMSLDLQHERLASTKPLPKQNGTVHHLVEVHGRLGIAAMDLCSVRNIQIWVSEDKGWSRRYNVYVNGRNATLSWLAQPHFVEDKYCILMRQCTNGRRMLHMHIPRDEMLKPIGVHISTTRGEHVVANISGNVSQIFSFVETIEPLSCYVKSQ